MDHFLIKANKKTLSIQWSNAGKASSESLSSQVQEDFLQKQQQQSQGNQGNYNTNASDLEPLQVGQKVRIQNHTTKKWDITGVVKAVGNNRSYLVKVKCGQNYWRNRRFIHPDMVNRP